MNNCRDNLRIVTKQQNARNQHSVRGKSKYKGVTWHKITKKWQAQIYFDTKNIYLGQYIKEIEAAKAYDKAALELFGEFSNLNFKEEEKQNGVQNKEEENKQ